MDAWASDYVGDIALSQLLDRKDVMPDVVCLPHGWGHHRAGMKISTASAHPGVSINDITLDSLIDELSGNAVFHGVPVEIEKSTRIAR